MIDQNPPVAAKYSNGALAYKRLPLQSSREEEALKAGLDSRARRCRLLFSPAAMPKEPT